MLWLINGIRNPVFLWLLKHVHRPFKLKVFYFLNKFTLATFVKRTNLDRILPRVNTNYHNGYALSTKQNNNTSYLQNINRCSQPPTCNSSWALMIVLITNWKTVLPLLNTIRILPLWSPLALVNVKGRRSPIRNIRVLCSFSSAQLIRRPNISFFPRRHLHDFHGHGSHIEMIVAPEETQRAWFQHIHLVHPIEFHLPDPISQVVWIRDHHLVHWSVFKSGRALGCQFDTPHCTSVRVNRSG